MHIPIGCDSHIAKCDIVHMPVDFSAYCVDWQDPERTRQVYLACLDLIPHKKVSVVFNVYNQWHLCF